MVMGDLPVPMETRLQLCVPLQELLEAQAQLQEVSAKCRTTKQQLQAKEEELRKSTAQVLQLQQAISETKTALERETRQRAEAEEQLSLVQIDHSKVGFI